MSVQIMINGDNAAEAIQEFATLSAAFTGQVTAPVKVSAPVIEKPRKEATKKVEEGVTDPIDVKGGSKPENKKEPEGDQVDIPSVVDLRAIGQEKGKTAEGKKKIKALLDKFESKSLSDVPEESRVAFMAELEAI